MTWLIVCLGFIVKGLGELFQGKYNFKWEQEQKADLLLNASAEVCWHTPAVSTKLVQDN